MRPHDTAESTALPSLRRAPCQTSNNPHPRRPRSVTRVSFAPMTIAIASYQRRAPLLRLLRALDDQVVALPALGTDLEIVVVLDGSTDGSEQAVAGEAWSVPVHARWQPNRGLAAARNVGLRAASGGIVWFLDDDVVPSPGLLERHRRAHDALDRTVVVGPCMIPPGAEGPAEVLQWWAEFHGRLRPGDNIDRYELFTAANASGAAAVFDDVGGFDETFTAYGLEDYELAVRLLAAGVRLTFDADAVAWHPEIEAIAVHIERERGIGLNAARITQLHPETLDLLFPVGQAVPSMRALARLRLRRPATLLALSRMAARASRWLGWHAAIAQRAEHLARSAARAAGVAEAGDAVLLDRLLGHDPRRAISRSSRQPEAIPTNKDPNISR